ncbi:MAG: 50S ribosomal protein L4 [Planctomycetota bacterium]
MIEIPVYNSTGSQTGTLPLDESKLGGEVMHGLLKQAFVRIHANKRPLNSPTKSRGMVRGSTRKLYKQKGTGNARRGDKKANILRGGGHAKAKVPHSWRQDRPAKMRRLANRNAILAKAIDGEIKLVEGFELDTPSTKQFAELLQALEINRTCLIALGDTRGALGKSARNLPNSSLTQVDRLNVFDLLNHRFLVAEKSAFEDYINRATASVREVAVEVAVEEVMA